MGKRMRWVMALSIISAIFMGVGLYGFSGLKFVQAYVGEEIYADDGNEGSVRYIIDEILAGETPVITSGDTSVYEVDGNFYGSNIIRVQEGADITLVLGNIERISDSSPLFIESGARVTLVLREGATAVFQSNFSGTSASAISAGITVRSGGELIIRSQTGGEPGRLIATGGAYSAGIGSGPNQNCGTIIIDGGNIIATSGGTELGGNGAGAGIGGGGGVTGGGGEPDGIIIRGNAVVVAASMNDGAGIGGAGGGGGDHSDSTHGSGATSGGGNGGTVEIYGYADVKAISMGDGAGIGGGARSNRTGSADGPGGSSGIIEIYGNAKVTAESHGNGAGIGGGGTDNGSGEGRYAGSADNIRISDAAVVKAESYGNGAGIGGGGCEISEGVAGAGGNIEIDGCPIIIAASGCDSEYAFDMGAGFSSYDGVAGETASDTIRIIHGNVRADRTPTVVNANGDEIIMRKIVLGFENDQVAYQVASEFGYYQYGAKNYGERDADEALAYIWAPPYDHEGHMELNLTPEPTDIISDKIYDDGNNTPKIKVEIKYDDIISTGGIIQKAKWMRVPVADTADYGDIDDDAVFEDKLDSADAANCGEPSVPENTASFNYTVNGDQNANYWFMAEFLSIDGVVTRVYKTLCIDYIYTPVEVYVQNLREPDNLVVDDYYKLELSPKVPYGIPFELDGIDDGEILASPPWGFDKLQYSRSTSPQLPVEYWSFTLPVEPFDADGEIVLDGDVTDNTGEDDTPSSGPVKKYYTAIYKRSIEKCYLKVYYVYANGGAALIGGNSSGQISVTLDEIPTVEGFETSDFKANGGVYLPPGNGSYNALGWYMADSSHAIARPTDPSIDPDVYFRQINFADFAPNFIFDRISTTPFLGNLADGKKLYIVYPNPPVSPPDGNNEGGDDNDNDDYVPSVPNPPDETIEVEESETPKGSAQLPGTTRPTVNDKLSAILETEAHIAYVSGYTDGTVRPNSDITRGEVAAIFWRLIKGSGKSNVIQGAFIDVNDNLWYAQAINYLTEIGILSGYEDGTFRPGQSITRAEFAVIASRFDDLILNAANPFVDIAADHWAYNYIVSAYAKGWLSGYPGNMFLPENNITRAEAVTIVNYMLGRGIRKVDIDKGLYNMYTDLTLEHWAFAEIIEASYEHEYIRIDHGFEVHLNH